MLVNIIIPELKLKTKVSSYQMYHLVLHSRDVFRFSNPGVLAVMWWA